jgi:YcxB-like protein
MSGEFDVSLSREDFIGAYWFYTRWLWLWRRMLLGIAGLALVYAAVMMLVDGLGYGFALRDVPRYLAYGGANAVAVAVILSGVTQITLPRRLKRLYNDLRVAGRETHFTFDRTGIRSSNRDGTSNFEWNRFKHWIENERFLLLILSRWSFIVIPKFQVTIGTLEHLRSAAASGGLMQR